MRPFYIESRRVLILICTPPNKGNTALAKSNSSVGDWNVVENWFAFDLSLEHNLNCFPGFLCSEFPSQTVLVICKVYTFLCTDTFDTIRVLRYFLNLTVFRKLISWPYPFRLTNLINVYVYSSIADETIPSLWEKTVTLTCPFDVSSCGELHSIKWTKGRETIALVSGDGQVVNVHPSYSPR